MTVPPREQALLEILARLAECAPRGMEVRVLAIDGRRVPKRLQVIKKGSSR